MQTDFFRKKLYIPTVGMLLVFFVLATLVYAAFLGQTQSVWLGQSFYFLLSDVEHVEAGAYDAQFSGGAGYLLEFQGNECVVLSVYMKEEEGIAVENSMADTANLLQINVGRLYFKSCEEKKNATLYQSALSSLHGCMEVLDLEINRLAHGATQQSSFRTLGILLKQLRYLATVYEEVFAEYAQVCKRASEELSDVLTDIIYVKDLRYLLCDLTANYIRICADFSL